MKLIKDSAIYLIGELFAKMIPFLMLPYLSHKLGASGFGELSYYQTYLALLLLALGLCQDGAVARYFYVYGKRSLPLIVTAGYFYTISIGIIMLIICWFYQSLILVYVVLTSIFQSLINVQLSIRQCQKQAIPYTVIQLSFGILASLFTIILLEVFHKDLVEKRFLALFLANILTFFMAFVLYQRKNTLKLWSLRQYKLGLLYIFSFGLPLMLHHLSLFARGQLDRIFIYHQYSQKELGLYAMGAMVASVASVAIMAVNKAILPYYYEALKNKKITLKQIHHWTIYSLIFVPIPTLILYFIPNGIIVWIFGQEFFNLKYYVMLFLISATLSIPYLLLVNYLFYHSKNPWISLCSIITTVFYLLSLIILLNTKIIYLPYASIIGAVVILPILYIMTKRTEKSL